MLKTKTLTTRILVPLVLSASLAALGVAWTSWKLGHRWALAEMSDRYQAIEESLQSSSYPLTQPVLVTLSKLTGTQWIAIDQQGVTQATTIALLPTSEAAKRLYSDLKVTTRLRSDGDENMSTDSPDVQFPVDVVVDATEFFAYRFDRIDDSSGRDKHLAIVVLFEKDKVNAVARKAALLPLVTGLSTIVLVSTLMFFVVSRLITRLKRLESQVQQIAHGDFQSEQLAELADEGADEVGRLADAINRMADQLRVLWSRVNQQQSSKLLHQISGGMAHQLRNTLTGAKLAMELHQSKLEANTPEEVRVALRQLEIAEDYISRLLALGNRKPSADRPQSVRECVEDVRSTHEPIAKHLRVDIRWIESGSLQDSFVKDGPSFSAAVSNLLLNAMQAGSDVEVATVCDQAGHCRLSVTDDGEGIDAGVADALFDPFVTSKPEGLGLGLPLVKRTAEYLGGSVEWRRESGKTLFELSVATIGRPDVEWTHRSGPVSNS